jgi:hypothetical protein
MENYVFPKGYLPALLSLACFLFLDNLHQRFFSLHGTTSITKDEFQKNLRQAKGEPQEIGKINFHVLHLKQTRHRPQDTIHDRGQSKG